MDVQEETIPETESKKTGRRRRRKKPPKEVTLFYNYVRGFLSKEHSINAIISGLSPDVVALCETKRPKQTGKKDILKGYEVIERNVKQGQEGLMIGVRTGSCVNK